MPNLLNIQPGWLLLLIGVVCLAVAAIFMLARARTLPTPQAAHLIPFTYNAGQPLALNTWQPLILQPTSVTANPASPNDSPHLRFDQARCYDTPKQVLCLGRVYNASTEPVESVSLRFTNAAPQPPVVLEQAYIPPLSYAPYRAWIETVWEERFVPQPLLELSTPSRKIAYELDILDERGEFFMYPPQEASYGRYIISAQLHNPYPKPIPSVEVIGALLDDTGYLVGYRIQPLEGGIKVGETIPIRMEITPMVAQSGFKYSLEILAWENEVEGQ